MHSSDSLHIDLWSMSEVQSTKSAVGGFVGEQRVNHVHASRPRAGSDTSLRRRISFFKHTHLQISLPRLLLEGPPHPLSLYLWHNLRHRFSFSNMAKGLFGALKGIDAFGKVSADTVNRRF